MKSCFCVWIFLVLCAPSVRSDEVKTYPIGQDPSPYLQIVFKTFDINNLTLSEMVTKLNAIIRKESKGPNFITVSVNLKGLSKTESTTVLDRKVIRFRPMTDVPLGEALAYVCQLTNGMYEMKGQNVVITAFPPYYDRVEDVEPYYHQAETQLMPDAQKAQ